MGDCVPQSKKIGCERFEEVWGKGGEEKKGFPVSHGDLHMEDIGGDEGQPLKECSRTLWKLSRFVK